MYKCTPEVEVADINRGTLARIDRKLLAGLAGGVRRFGLWCTHLGDLQFAYDSSSSTARAAAGLFLVDNRRTVT